MKPCKSESTQQYEKENYMIFFQFGEVIILIQDFNDNSASSSVSTWFAI